MGARSNMTEQQFLERKVFLKKQYIKILKGDIKHFQHLLIETGKELEKLKQATEGLLEKEHKSGEVPGRWACWKK